MAKKQEADLPEQSGGRSDYSRLCINTDILYENHFPIAKYNQFRKRNPSFAEFFGDDCSYFALQRMYSGQASPVHGRIVQLEVALNHSHRLETSFEAFRRYIERINGQIPLYGEKTPPKPLPSDRNNPAIPLEEEDC